ncbi:MAG TPA: hypothetical protein VK177_12010 [Flavobacteriales bacterium]|nr:hypothetical protein [Flavobacteriales bacterium]
MTEKTDFVVYYGSVLMNSSAPMKHCDACVIGTKNYIFFVPKQTVGIYAILTTWKNHKFFEGVSVEEGVKNFIASCSSIDQLEKGLIALLEDDPKYVHKLSDLKSFKFRGFLGKHTVRMSTGGMNWTSVSPKGKGTSKEMRSFYGQ